MKLLILLIIVIVVSGCVSVGPRRSSRAFDNLRKTNTHTTCVTNGNYTNCDSN